MKLLSVSKKIAFVMIIAVGIFSGFSLSASSVRQILPQSELDINKSLPTNNLGETYGTCYDIDPDFRDPDLIKAEGINGKVGYVRTIELDYDSAETPDEALAQNDIKSTIYINLYEKDGKTIIDQFAITPGTESEEINVFKLGGSD